MKRILLIGLGAGDPSGMTLQAIEAIRAAEVFFLMEKEGEGKSDLIAFRQAALKRARGDGGYRLVSAVSPERPSGGPDYRAGIEWWRGERRRIFREMIETELSGDGTGAFLIVGDPSLYDGTVEILHELTAEGLRFEFEVVPGITSLQLLAAGHRIALNRIGEDIRVMTARQLSAAALKDVTNALVMLDGRAAFRRFAGTDLHIWWGAYLGMPEEILVAGPLREKAEEIAAIIERERARRGWIMDTYLLRRP
ncbi:precorrin-6A synthase (deacetylating) [Afifella sp. IM 167]|uniref:precorrin-6A synthase (deacetylating) n=1 Tax=Afifella sp. IM 167 TaxID=2033586 RepID=UPI001CCA5103|nr:precorrin-6A synthase (deacetylating) [Afifella sp. IM 167]MBZ8134521.1 precorrin-6A synthase (deacetylating) [Afifella sp. IM 167]